MNGRPVSRLGRRSRLTRRLTLVTLTLVALSVVASALTRAPRPERRKGPPPAGSTVGLRSLAEPRHSALVSAGERADARRAARRFLAGYLPLIYGRGSARSVGAAAPDVRLG